MKVNHHFVPTESESSEYSKTRKLWLSDKATPALTKEKEKELLKDKKTGEYPSEYALDILIRSNIPVIIKTCSRDFSLGRGGMMRDALSVGVYAMILASKDYDPNGGASFMSYTMVRVKYHIIDFMIKNRTIESRGGGFIKTALAVLKELKKQNKTYLDYSSIPLIAEATGLSENQVGNVMPFLDGTKSIEDHIQEGDHENDMVMSYRPQTLDSKLVVWENFETVEKDQEKGRLNEAVKNSLDEKEYFVYSRIFGLNENTVLSLEEIGQLFLPQVTRQRVHQIYNRAMSKLRKDMTINGINRSVVYG